MIKIDRSIELTSEDTSTTACNEPGSTELQRLWFILCYDCYLIVRNFLGPIFSLRGGYACISFLKPNELRTIKMATVWFSSPSSGTSC
jgi:hypothetical protein